MDRLYLMTVFVAVAEKESFAGAARQLGMSPPAVTRAIATLEARLAVKLLDRTTRYVRVTEVGQGYLQDARRIIIAADEADHAVVGGNAEPRGHLVVTAPVLFGRMYVMPGIIDYLRAHPGTDVSALFLDRVVNMMEEGVDVGIRIGELGDSSYRALRVGQVRRVVCASPAYLDQFGIPTVPEELTGHTLVVASSMSARADWRFQCQGKALTLQVKPRLVVSSNDAAIEAALRGIGLTRVMSYQIAPMLASGELKIVLSEFETPPVPIHIIHREGRHASAKIRCFIDLMAARLRADSSLA
ncbi:LysR family transcriptional regulator [Massilia sp. P8910]|uniref:LysR family transcriptional regulator n=1 Tax=Massilia antarctica TaxID=2765360 RepID=UPI001E2DBD0A|nr:LysR family transcriptional regulator [Massilia antarctica]MCE3605352.1 LysR family transcriptional regulator [Massilia antarctica]